MNRDVHNTVLSFSPSEDALRFRETTLRSGGLNVISVMSAVQARFEIEMGRCGILLICYRTSEREADELIRLFRRSCLQGRVVFVTQSADDTEVPPGTDMALPEGSPELILQAVIKSGNQFPHSGVSPSL